MWHCGYHAHDSQWSADACEIKRLRAEIERLRAKEAWADEASELLYNFATGKDDGAAIIAHVRAKLETV